MDVNKASATVNRKVYFAGDYADFYFMGTTTGAFISGIETAN